MKVAVLLTGHCRSYESTFESLKQFVLDKYNCDLYFNTWDVNQPSLQWDVKATFSLPNIPVDQSKLIQKYSPYLKKYNFESWENYPNNRFPNISFLDRVDDVFKVNSRAIHHGSYWVERLRDQWWMIQKAWNLIDNPHQYDIIFRTRFDLQINQIEFKNQKFVVPKSIIPHYNIGTYWSDHMAYGDSYSMEKYCNMIEHIESMYITHNIDISHAEEMNEFYMREYIQKIECYIDDNMMYSKI